MNRDRIDGAGKKAMGSMKDAAGKVTGDTKLRVEGKAEEAAGSVQNAAGKARDGLKH
ncbi:MAG: CsbD family protein [Proteobacteria bacterium]|nr:CsbD family protein [Pseudomonadota bacterium]